MPTPTHSKEARALVERLKLAGAYPSERASNGVQLSRLASEDLLEAADLISALQVRERELVEALTQIAAEGFGGPPGISIYAAAANELKRRVEIARSAISKAQGSEP